MTVPTTSEPLGRLSPARLERLLACPLRVAFGQRQRGEGQGVRSPAALVGLAAHRAIELVVKKEAETAEAWEHACEELAREGPDPGAVSGARRALLRLERRLPELVRYIDERSPVELRLDESLVSPDGSIHGRPDLLLVGDRPAVVDFKSGRVMEGEGPHVAQRRQLVIYAWLAAVCVGVEVEAALFSLRHGIVAVDVSPSARAEVMAEATRAREEFNGRAPGPQPGRPGTAWCRWCPFACSCDELWLALETGRVDRVGWGEAVQGEISSSVVTTASGVAAIPIQIRRGTRSGPAMVIDVPQRVASGLEVGDQIALVGLIARLDETPTLIWSDLTSRFRRLPES